MRSRRAARPLFVLALAASACLGGCAGQGTLLAPRTTVGSLRTSVSHLQHENEQLKRQVADLKAGQHELEDQLVQEEARNGDLTARLDDARHALRGHADGATTSLENEPAEPPQRALPAGRSTKKKRKPPYAQIPHRVEEPPADDDLQGAPVRDLRSDASDPPTRREGSHGWLPVARGPMSPLVR